MLRTLLATLLLGALLPAQSEAVFDQQWQAVQQKIARGQWAEARSGLEQLLLDHERKLYVLAARDAIVEDHKRCSFHMGCRQPKPEDLISGELLRWDAASGQAHLRYRPDRLQDFETSGNFLLHPAMFTGPYSVTMSGTYPKDQGTVQIVYDMQGESWCLADWGAPQGARSNSRPAQPIACYRGNGQQVPVPTGAKARTPVEPGKPFTLTLAVNATRVDLSYQHKQVVSQQRDAPELCRIGITRGSFDELTIEGRIEPAWLQGLVDQKLSDQRLLFEQRYRPQQRLPAWLFERPTGARTARKSTSDLPGDGPAVQQVLGPALDRFGKGDYVACVLALDLLPEGAAPGPARDFLQAAALVRMGEPQLALKPCERALKAEPTFTPLRLLHADVLAELRRSPQALAEMRAALQDDPGDERIYQRLVPHLLRHGAAAEARLVLRAARSRHGLWDETAALDRTVAMAERGPGWHRRFGCNTAHYEITSDIDARVCSDAGRILEELHRSLLAELGADQEARQPQRLRVFLFSGEAGYQDYCRQILGSPVPHTGGLYSPILKQLLIWNLPSREEMEHTIRHEGFHQFLDRMIEAAPVWFDEGLAQFYESATRVRGKLEGGQVDRVKLQALPQRETLPRLRALVYGSRGDFYRNAGRRYPHAWALVHFLRRGPPVNQRRFATLLQELKSGVPAEQALDSAFAGVDWDACEAEFWAYIGRL